jgi:hypothetical protein
MPVVDPPIEVESATWSAAGDLDYWVKERQEWLGRVRVQTDVRSGSKQLIFVRPKRAESTGDPSPGGGYLHTADPGVISDHLSSSVVLSRQLTRRVPDASNYAVD